MKVKAKWRPVRAVIKFNLERTILDTSTVSNVGGSVVFALLAQNERK